MNRIQANLPESNFLMSSAIFWSFSQKHKLGIGRWDLASCQVSLNYVLWFQRRSRKCISSIRGQGGHLVFPIGPKNPQTSVEDAGILLSNHVSWTWAMYMWFHRTWRIFYQLILRLNIGFHCILRTARKIYTPWSMLVILSNTSV